MKKIISILLLLTMILNTTLPTINSIVELNASEISSENSEQEHTEELEVTKIEENTEGATENQVDLIKEIKEENKIENAPPGSLIVETEEELRSANSNKTQEFLIVSEEVFTKSTYNVEMYPHNTLDIGDFSTSHWGQLMYFIVNGDIVFCIESTKDINNSASAQTETGSVFSTFSTQLRTQIQIISAYGLEKYQETNNDDYLYATQILIWKFIEPYKYDVSGGTSLQNEINDIMNLYSNHYNLVSFMGSSEENAPINTLKWNESNNRYEVTLNDTNDVANYKLEDFPLTSGDYNFEVNGDKLTIYTTNENASSKTIEYNYTPYENGDNKYYDGGQDLIQAHPDPLVMYLKLEIEPTLGDLEITKVGQTLEPNSDEIINLEGAEFNLVDSEGNIIKTGITDSKGNLEFNDLKFGEYTLVEIKAPEGYLKASNTNVEIIPNETKSVEITDELDYGNLKITKVGQTLEPNSDEIINLEGAEFNLLDEEGNIIKTGTTDSKGNLEFKNLKFGKYTLVETNAPKGYLKADDVEITINSSETKSIEITDDIITSSVTLTKIGHEYDNTYETLQDVEFTLFQDVDEDQNFETEIGKYYTDNLGVILIDDLKYGNYKLIETSVGDNYYADFQSEFNIRTNGEVITLDSNGEYVVNEKIRTEIHILKTGESLDPVSEEKVILEGAEFTLFEDINDNGILEDYEILFNQIETKATDSEGNVVFDNILPYENYIIKETLAPKGYAVSDELIIVNSDTQYTIEKDLKIADFNINNEILTNTIQIDKTDVGGNELPGAEIEIKNTETNEMVDKWTSTTETHEIELEYGKYSICETLAPEGYLLNTQCIDFEVSTDGVTQEFAIINEVIKSGTITLTKTDNVTGELLEGAEFELLVLNESGDYENYIHNNTDKFITKSDGTLTLNEVAYGNYALREIKAPNGYVVNDKLIPFEVAEEGATIDLTFTNTEIPVIANTGLDSNTIFIIIIILLIIALLITKIINKTIEKRKEKEKDVK